MYYLVLCICDILFATQFLFNQKFEEEYGSSLMSSMIFSFYTSAFGFLVLFAGNGFRMEFSYFSCIMAMIYAIIGVAYCVASVKAFENVNLSAYSVFAMLGGMLLPSVYGIIFCADGITVTKFACYILIAVSLFFGIDFKEKSGKKIYYGAVFVLNGLVGVVSVIHQSVGGFSAVDSSSFLMLARLWATIISLFYILKNKKSAVGVKNVKSVAYTFAFAVFTTVGNLLLLISLEHLPASVQYPIVTGGVMAVSLIISIVGKEKITVKNIISTSVALISTFLIAFSNT